jgi:hypothetical protein
MRALRATAEAMRAWTTEMVDRERAPVTWNVRASERDCRSGLGPGRDTLFHREMPDEISPSSQAPPRSPGGCWGGTQTGRDSSILGPRSNAQGLGIDPEGGTGHVVLSNVSRQISTSPGSPVVPPTRTVKTCPLGVMDPRREGKGSPPVMGILFHRWGERIPGSLGALFPVRPLRGGTGQGTGT